MPLSTLSNPVPNPERTLARRSGSPVLASIQGMMQTVTITHHQAKPEYKWEVVIPEGPTVLLADNKLAAALQTLGLPDGNDLLARIQALPNGESHSLNVDFSQKDLPKLVHLGVKTV